MTDNEIIKAMQCVIGNDVSCSECTYQKKLPFPSCRRMCAKNTLNLINRQKVEIESLKQIIDEQDKEIIKLQKRIIFWREDLNYQPEKIKSEAIKEFIDELKNRVVNKYEYTDIRVFKEIDNLVEELTE